MALGFYFDMTACIGCKTCQIACKDKNDLPLGTLYRNIESYETGEFPKPGAYHLSVSCNHCEKPACVEMCPTKQCTSLRMVLFCMMTACVSVVVPA